MLCGTDQLLRAEITCSSPRNINQLCKEHFGNPIASYNNVHQLGISSNSDSMCGYTCFYKIQHNSQCYGRQDYIYRLVFLKHLTTSVLPLKSYWRLNHGKGVNTLNFQPWISVAKTHYLLSLNICNLNKRWSWSEKILPDMCTMIRAIVSRNQRNAKEQIIMSLIKYLYNQSVKSVQGQETPESHFR